MFWEHFGAKPCYNHGGSQKSQSFGAKTLEGLKKKVSGHWVAGQLKTPKLWCFVVFLTPSLFFFRPASVLAPIHWFFWDLSVLLEHFGAKPCQSQGGSQNQSFGAKTLEGLRKTKNKASGHWVAGQIKTPQLWCFVGFLRPSSVLAPIHWFFGTSQCSVRFSSKM